MNGLRPQPGSPIVILGTGAVGLAAILGAVVSGCAKIIAVDRNDSNSNWLAGLAKRGTLGLVAVPPSTDIFILQMIDLYAQGRFPDDKFVRFYPFAEINRAVEDQRNGIAIKPILKVAAPRLGEMK
jgi:aryl-alcohol dehydrogenase